MRGRFRFGGPAYAKQKTQAVLAGHGHGSQQYRRRGAVQGFERLGGRSETLSGNGSSRQGFFEHPSYALVVVDYPYRFHHCSRGRIIRNSVRPACVSNSTTPPCCWTNSCVRLRPRPVPLARPVTRGWKILSRSCTGTPGPLRSEEHTSELQSLMRISYAVFCLKKKTKIDSI